MNQESLNSSLIYGEAYVLSKCTDEHLIWEDNDSNSDQLNALFSLMQQQELVFIVTSNYNMTQQKLTPLLHHYAFIPAAFTHCTSAFLLRHIAVADQVLPINIERTTQLKVSECAMSSIRDVIDTIDQPDAYNPLDYSLGYHQQIKYLIQRSSKFYQQPQIQDTNSKTNKQLNTSADSW
eukprot:CAMPEP_0174256374 /NCGR_PEP_ID=MMETSP0439-20130205/5617_1 /TAXON_ID=0 /ORGANISM="Stereomyxa ramosa, Strain Chinc5" /LENGTH=178 /DNA_ID=CAMNT_0015338953 /DNA_START=1029 /DNA_END=1562 /DNA_ORIENTATION=-